MLINARQDPTNINSTIRVRFWRFLGRSFEGCSWLTFSERIAPLRFRQFMECIGMLHGSLLVWVIVWPSSLSLSFSPLSHLSTIVSSVPPVAWNNENGGPTRLLPVALFQRGTSGTTLRRRPMMDVNTWTKDSKSLEIDFSKKKKKEKRNEKVERNKMLSFFVFFLPFLGWLG